MSGAVIFCEIQGKYKGTVLKYKGTVLMYF